MGDETAEEFGSSWPLIHRESLPSDADSGYEPSPAFSSAQASFEWPTGEEDAAASDCPPPPPNEARSAAIPIPRRRQQQQLRWPNDAVDVATQTSLVAAAATSMPPDLVPRIEEHQAPTHRLRWALAGVQLRRISDDFARSPPPPAPPNSRRRSFPASLLRSE